MMPKDWRTEMADIINNNNEPEELENVGTVIEEANDEAIEAESYERELVTLTDENGVDIEFEIIGRMSYNNNEYIALMSEDNDDNYLILKREIEENGDESYVTIEDDDEFDAVADAFDDEFMSEIDLDFGAGSDNN